MSCSNWHRCGATLKVTTLGLLHVLPLLLLFLQVASWPSTAQHVKAQHGAAQHSTAQHSTAQHSTAQHSTAQHSTAQHSTAQHSTAQHSTAQHSTAQHSTAQPSTDTLTMVNCRSAQQQSSPVASGPSSSSCPVAGLGRPPSSSPSPSAAPGPCSFSS